MGRSHAWALSAIVALGLAARLGAIGPRLGQAPDDPDNYLPLARSLAAGEGYRFNGRPTAYRPPLYPLALAPMVRVLGLGPGLMWGVTAFHLLLGATTIVLAQRAAAGAGLSAARSLAAAALVAFDPVLVVQTRSVMTETMAACLLAAALWAMVREQAKWLVLGGFLLGLLVLCRPSLLAWWGLCVVAALLCQPGDAKTRVRRAVCLATPVALVLLPWGYRNARALGEPVWTTTHGGYTLYLANNPVYYREVVHGPPGAVWSGPAQAAWFKEVNRGAAGMSEPKADRHFAREAWRVIAAQPGDFVRASLARLGRFGGVAPADAVYPAWMRWATALWTVPFWAALVLGALQPGTRRWPLAAAAAAIVGLSLVHTVFWTDLRMRAPIVPALALVAAGAHFNAASLRRFLRRGRAEAAGGDARSAT